ncbi:MAG: carbohydrate kinase [Anaerolineae bacterium]|jgi:sugar/nucleoside kinase (ribokinase family)|nr:MAG: carbohydrate kinase [Anaerolineae bacterium]
MTEKSIDLLVPGEINPDLILNDPHLEARFGQQEVLVQDFEMTIGSSSAIFACGAARLGLKTTLIGVIGEDPLGKFMMDALRQRNVDISPLLIDHERKTGVSVILSRGSDRAILTYLGCIDALEAHQIPDSYLAQTRHLHVCSIFLQSRLRAGLPDLFRRARNLGVTISLDTNWDPSGRWEGILGLIAQVDVFLPNEQEALAITGSNDLNRALELLEQHCPLVVIKRGEQGAIARQKGETVTSKALTVAVVDTVGAGDSFNAGFIYGYLAGFPLKKALELGIACGSLSTRAAGGVNAQPTLEEALQYVSG